jgi:hypothetical protein
MSKGRVDLNETGTRMDHYLELRELFLDGVTILKNLNPTYRTDADEARITRLQNAADEIWKRFSHLSNYANETTYGSDMQRDIDAIHKTKTKTKLLTEGHNVQQGNNSDAEGEGTQTDS